VRRLAAWLSLLLLALLGYLAWQVVWGKPPTLDLFYHRVVARTLLESPMLLSQLRILEPYGIHFHADELDDFSVAATDRRAARLRRELAVLRRFVFAPGTPEEQRSWDVMHWFLGTLVEGERFRFHDYPVNQLEGVQSRLPDFMLNTHQVNDLGDARRYAERLERFGVAIDQTIDSVRHRAAFGVVPPRFVIERVREEIAGFVSAPPARHVLVTHLDGALAGLREGAITADQRSDTVERARRAVEQEVLPAYRRLDGALAGLLPLAGRDDGAWHLPDGAAYYAWTLRLHTTTSLSADEIHAVGLAETARIQGEIRAILAAEGRASGDLAADLIALHADPAFLYPDEDASRATILADYQAILDEASARLPEWFGRLPKARVVVERVPPFKEAGAPGAYYMPAPLDGSKPGVFYANLRQVGETTRFGMRTLAYHEGVPGHHLQVSLAFENSSLPLFRRLVPFNAFVEGWALYAERLAAEEGLHPTPYDRVGQLVGELFRAVRLVVDTGIHARRWTREEAIDYMRRNTGMPETDVVAEIERYIVNPGQACGYKLGQLEILRLREHARAALGERFDLRAFHDLVLGGGGLPLEILAQMVEGDVRREVERLQAQNAS
jgi:uncharacterized protein (DUF885 family)